MKPVKRSDGKRYSSIADAARDVVAENGVGSINAVMSNISNVARKAPHYKSAYGYGWEYCEPLGEAYDEALRRIAQLERENTDLRMMYGASRMRVGLLESLVRDMDRDCRGCKHPCFTEKGSCGIITRIDELLKNEVDE